jgi:ABC-2 type transport system ATP-binding protein
MEPRYLRVIPQSRAEKIHCIMLKNPLHHINKGRRPTSLGTAREKIMIHVEGLTKYYDDFCAVDHIDLDIKGGEIVGLLGPNGAGKTTTLRMLTGYFQPTTGDIRVKDFSIHQDLLAIKRLIGYLPESAPLYKNMLVYDYLDHVASIRGLDGSAKQQRLTELADMCGLRGIMHQTIDTLSKGLKQRVGLAHAMMSDPEILILDEPTSGLDPNQIVEIREIIRKIGERKTVILSTHILSEAEATCDRVIIINKGRIIADGSTHQLTASGENRFHIGLLNAGADAVRTKLRTVRGVKDVTTIDGDDSNMTRVSVICASADDIRADLYAAIKATDWIMVELTRESQTLETIFRELTREN